GIWNSAAPPCSSAGLAAAAAYCGAAAGGAIRPTALVRVSACAPTFCSSKISPTTRAGDRTVECICHSFHSRRTTGAGDAGPGARSSASPSFASTSYAQGSSGSQAMLVFLYQNAAPVMTPVEPNLANSIAARNGPDSFLTRQGGSLVLYFAARSFGGSAGALAAACNFGASAAGASGSGGRATAPPEKRAMSQERNKATASLLKSSGWVVR